jgi:hypothetical protein
MKRENGIIENCEDDDLIRMWGLLRSTLAYVETEMDKRKIPRSKVEHSDKKLTVQYIKSDNEFEVDFK